MFLTSCWVQASAAERKSHHIAQNIGNRPWVDRPGSIPWIMQECEKCKAKKIKRIGVVEGWLCVNCWTYFGGPMSLQCPLGESKVVGFRAHGGKCFESDLVFDKPIIRYHLQWPPRPRLRLKRKKGKVELP